MKRAYPFEDCFSNQSKFHVGEKEVNQGVLHDVNMQNVYAKTMQLLMDGSRNLSNNNVTGVHLKSVVTPPAERCRANGLRQMALTPHGSICLAPAAETSQAAGSSAVPVVCSACLAGKAAAAANCNFCEAPLCVACVASCVRCMGTYCRHCRVVVYEQHDDVTVCLSCNR